jgi:hypothetical protein
VVAMAIVWSASICAVVVAVVQLEQLVRRLMIVVVSCSAVLMAVIYRRISLVDSQILPFSDFDSPVHRQVLSAAVAFQPFPWTLYVAALVQRRLLFLEMLAAVLWQLCAEALLAPIHVLYA